MSCATARLGQSRSAGRIALFDDAALLRRVIVVKMREALADATRRFDSSATPRLDAELLMAHALGITREALLLGQLDAPVPPSFAALVERRAAYEPIAYITGHRAFWTIELSIGPGVLVPRADSEALIEAAVDWFGAARPRRILDLGTGPGTLLLAALDQWPQASGLGIDMSSVALEYARRNAAALGMSARAEFRRGDWATGLEETFDLILANPPYIAKNAALPEEVYRHEPPEALFAGEGGLQDYRKLIPGLRKRVAIGGAAILEIGSDQAQPVSRLLIDNSFKVSLCTDLAGLPRVLVAT